MNKRIAAEQYAEADLLAVMLFANVWLMVRSEYFQWSKKTCHLAQAA
jgi:hypothetical protein